MKSNKLTTKLFLTLLGIAGLTAVNAQSWTAASGSLYANPITTAKIGIGTSAPTYDLHLASKTIGATSGTFTTTLNANGINIYNTTPTSSLGTYINYGSLKIVGSGGQGAPIGSLSPKMVSVSQNGDYSRLDIGSATISNNTTYPNLMFSGAKYSFQLIQATSGKIQFTNLDLSKTYMSIDNTTGYVGIGTVIPSAMLTVNGTIAASEVDVQNIAADFVFDSNYKLSSLKDVESYISANKHLPGVAPAAETVKGVKLGEFNQTLLQKVEELTLYIIELQKQVEQLKKQ